MNGVSGTDEQNENTGHLEEGFVEEDNKWQWRTAVSAEASNQNKAYLIPFFPENMQVRRNSMAQKLCSIWL